MPVRHQAGMYAVLVLLEVFCVAASATLIQRQGIFAPAIDGLPGGMFFVGECLVAASAANFAMYGIGVFCLFNMQ